MVYNAVANEGRMMKPYLVNAVVKDGKSVKAFTPVELKKAICSPKTLQQLRTCLEGVVINGTGKSLSSPYYKIAGKTGTALVADGKKGYSERIYQSSFAGYFPADAPKYSCIVVIKNKPFAAKYYGAAVAGPVFKAISDKLMTVDQEMYPSYAHHSDQDSLGGAYTGAAADFKMIAKHTGMKFNDVGRASGWARLETGKKSAVVAALPAKSGIMPDLRGFGLKDALELLEAQQLLLELH
jgi:cell division protein FtsI (penicillin-binding protein 3)